MWHVRKIRKYSFIRIKSFYTLLKIHKWTIVSLVNSMNLNKSQLMIISSNLYLYLKLRQVKIFCSWKKCWLGSWKGTKSVMWLKGRVGSLGASKYYFPPQLDFSAVLYLWQTPPLTNRSDLKYTIPFQITERQQGRWVTFWTFQKGLLDDFQNILRRKARIHRIMSTSPKVEVTLAQFKRQEETKDFFFGESVCKHKC